MNNLKQFRVPLVVLFSVLFVWWGWVWCAPRLVRWIFRAQDLDNLAQYGQFGDLFGGVNALFTALALAAVAWTAVMQKQQLDVQAQELRDQKAALEQDRRLAAVQAAESTLFHQINLFHGIARDLEFTGANNVEARGLNALHSLANGCRDILQSVSQIENLNDDSIANEVKTRFNLTFTPILRSLIDPLLRSIYYSISQIDKNSYLTESEKVSYVNIIRGLMSIDLLFLVGVAGVALPEMGLKRKIEQYGFLKHLPQASPASLLRRCYMQDAFLGLSGRVPRAAAQSQMVS